MAGNKCACYGLNIVKTLRLGRKVLPLMKSYRNGTTRFHGETKNTKLFFKRYLKDTELMYPLFN